MENTKTREQLERELQELDPDKEGEEFEGKRDGIIAALEKLPHQHKWHVNDLGNIIFVRCDCGLQIECYQSHVSLWNYKGKLGSRMIDSIDYPVSCIQV